MHVSFYHLDSSWYPRFNLSQSPITGRKTCTITDSTFQEYITDGFLVTLTGILPIFITVTVGSLAYRNVRQIPYRIIPLVRRELNKQLTPMILIQVVYNFLVIFYFLITVNSLYYALSINMKIFSKNVFHRIHFIFICVYQNGTVNNLFMLFLVFILNIGII